MDLHTFLTQTYPFTVVTLTDAPRGLVAQTHFATLTDGTTVFVKAVHAPLFKPHLVHSAASHAYLSEQLGDRINAPIATRSGAGVARWDDAVVAVSQVIAAPLTEQYDVHAFGQLIARLHSVPIDPRVPTRRIADFAHRGLLDTLGRQAFDGTGLHPAVTARLAPWRETFWHYHTRLRHYEQAMRALPQQPLVYTHGDAGGNVVANDAHNLHLIDWDYIGLSEPERDLWVFEFYPDFVAGYQSIIPSYQPNEVRLQYAAYRQFFDYLVYFLSALHATPVADDPTHTIDNLLSLFTDWCQPHMR
jgi:aminoglycoside phosphotransferase (APT) family kinase protein